MIKYVLTFLLLLPGVAGAADLTPSINTTSYVCGCDGGWALASGCYCTNMLNIVEQYIGWADGCLNDSRPAWSDSVRAHDASVRMLLYSTLKGNWATVYSDTANVPVGRHALYPVTMYFTVRAELYPDSLDEDLFEHYQDTVVFFRDNSGTADDDYVIVPMADPEGDGIEAADSVSRVIYYANDLMYNDDDSISYGGQWCKQATGKGRVLLAMDQHWKRVVVSRALAHTVNTTSPEWFKPMNAPYYSLYMDNCDHGNSQVHGTGEDYLGTVAASYEAHNDSNSVIRGSSGNWPEWKHQNMIKQILVIRDSIEARRAGARLAINVVWDVDYDNYIWIDTSGGGDYTNLARVQLNGERLGGYRWVTANDYVGRYLLDWVADIETLMVYDVPTNWDSWLSDSLGTSSTVVSIPASGYDNTISVLNYAAMCNYYLVKPQAVADDTLMRMSFNAFSCGACKDTGDAGDWEYWHWIGAMGRDVGSPDSTAYICYSGPCDDGPGDRSGVGTDTTQMFRRDYNSEGFIIISHPCWSWSSHENNILGDSIYVTYNPGDHDWLWPLMADNTYGDSTQSVNIPIGTGAILATANPAGGVVKRVMMLK